MVGPGAGRTRVAEPGVGETLPVRHGGSGPLRVVGEPAAVAVAVVHDAVRVHAVRPAVVRVVVAEVHQDDVADLGAQDGAGDAGVAPDPVRAQVRVERALPAGGVRAVADRPERGLLRSEMTAHHRVVAVGDGVVLEGFRLDPELPYPPVRPELREREGVAAGRGRGLRPGRCRQQCGGARQRGRGAAADQPADDVPAAVVAGLFSHGVLSTGRGPGRAVPGVGPAAGARLSRRLGTVGRPIPVAAVAGSPGRRSRIAPPVGLLPVAGCRAGCRARCRAGRRLGAVRAPAQHSTSTRSGERSAANLPTTGVTR